MFRTAEVMKLYAHHKIWIPSLTGSRLMIIRNDKERESTVALHGRKVIVYVHVSVGVDVGHE